MTTTGGLESADVWGDADDVSTHHQFSREEIPISHISTNLYIL
jgi:hypothetical protein